MLLQRLIKIFGAAASLAVLFTLNGCSSSKNATPVTTLVQPPASFDSSPVCAKNAFLRKYECSFLNIEAAARSGDPDAQYALGYLYYYGIGTAKDQQTGLMWIRKAAAQGQSIAKEALRDLSGSNATIKANPPPSPTSLSPSAGDAVPVDSAAAQAHVPTPPEKPLTDYLPNYGEKRVNTTATPPPTVDLSTSPGGGS